MWPEASGSNVVVPFVHPIEAVMMKRGRLMVGQTGGKSPKMNNYQAGSGCMK